MSQSTSRAREYLIVLLVLALAGVAAWWIFGLTWEVQVTPSDGMAPAKELGLTGRFLYPYAGFIGVVALAAVAGILATKKYGRIIIGVLLALLAGSAVVQIVTDFGVRGVAIGAEVALTVITGCAVVTVIRGSAWPMLGSKYERTKPKESESAWDQLDRGEDPTL